MRLRGAPDWWRGTRPFPLPVPPDTVVLRGEVAQADIPTFDERPADLQGLSFREARAVGLTISLDDRHFGAYWSEFEHCTFTQRRSGRVLNESGTAAQGTLGWVRGPSIYRRCRFEGVRFMSMGGYSMDAAMFEDCVFDRCRFNGHRHTTADLVDCHFIGKVDGCTWYGTAPEYDGGRRNVVRGNDFTDAVIGWNVGWRGDFDFEAQVWPEGFVPTVDDPADA